MKKKWWAYYVRALDYPPPFSDNGWLVQTYIQGECSHEELHARSQIDNSKPRLVQTRVMCDTPAAFVVGQSMGTFCLPPVERKRKGRRVGPCPLPSSAPRVKNVYVCNVCHIIVGTPARF